MAQKSKRIRKIKKGNKSRRRNKEEQLRPEKKHEESHHYYSKMVFDGNTMITESQKDNEPVKRRKYTLEDLEREIPIGAELVKDHLDRKVPRAIQYPLPKGIEFTSVLPSPDDLGLMPPKQYVNHTRKNRRNRQLHRHHELNEDNEGENLHLMIEENGNDHTNRRHKFTRDLFGLP